MSNTRSPPGRAGGLLQWSYEVVEAYPEDKYFPSYLLLGRQGEEAFHALFGADVEGQNVRVVTAYYPSPEEWEEDLKTRRPK